MTHPTRPSDADDHGSPHSVLRRRGLLEPLMPHPSGGITQTLVAADSTLIREGRDGSDGPSIPHGMQSPDKDTPSHGARYRVPIAERRRNRYDWCVGRDDPRPAKVSKQPVPSERMPFALDKESILTSLTARLAVTAHRGI